jgi:DNA topoisomerase-2
MERTITDFFDNDFTDWAAYDAYRSLANYVDGLNVSARKVIHTIISDRIKKPYKVAQLAPRVAGQTQYLHGEGSLEGVIVGLARDFAGTNNVPLLYKKGHFGNRISPAASAGRYIYTHMLGYTEKIFRLEDNEVLIQQEFEGDDIEPRFFVPTIPLILVNGNRGVGSGFAQRILPRDPIEIIEHLELVLRRKKSDYDYCICFEDFEGEIYMLEDRESSSYEIHGICERLNSTTVHVSEVPIGTSHAKYIKDLDKLEDKGIISRYTDRSNDDTFDIEVKFPRAVLNKLDDEQLMYTLKLINTVTETLTCNDENLEVREFNSPAEIMEAYIEIKLEYTEKRRQAMIAKMERELEIVRSRYHFVKRVVEGKLKLARRPIKGVIADLDKIKEIVRVDGTYDYALHMQISSMTKEKYEALKKHIDKIERELIALKKNTAQKMWLKDLAELKKDLTA